MCGIAGLHLLNPKLYPHLGELLGGMLHQAAGRGNDSAGVGLYAAPGAIPASQSTVCALDQTPADQAVKLISAAGPKPGDLTAANFGQTLVVTASSTAKDLADAVLAALPKAAIISRGHDLTVLKGTGQPSQLAQDWHLAERGGWQGVAHTRMATESAVTPGGSHPFSVGFDECLIHNGSFSNHESIRKRLSRAGLSFDSLNDTEVAARFVAHQLENGATSRQALTELIKTFDGFYTLLVSSARSFAVVRDAIACKPAIIAETPDLVAVASEYRYLAGLPGIASARIFEPDPEVIYLWERPLSPAQSATTSQLALSQN
ncbi:MAG: hypothetical protein LBJ62_09710 [Bifidobacteriaceae bacterium]|jgi:glutamate synthase domain-containing protein 1|nr:hypothetical protein [Bifidobacteriaceae bacterium]